MKTYIFACNSDTMPECLWRNLFGVGKHYVTDISPDDFCYLYNYSDRQLYGVWKATSGCAWHEREAWGGRFRNQVRVQRVSKTYQSFPLYVVRNLIQVNGEIKWKLYGDKAQNLLQYFAHRYSSEVLFGLKLTNLEQDYRQKFPPEYMCEDGHRVRSLSEQAIDNWFYRHKVFHAYEPIIPIPEQLIPDFMVNRSSGEPVYMEFWGMLNDPIYRKRMMKKSQIYADRHFPLIELRPDDLMNLDYVLAKELAQRNVPFS